MPEAARTGAGATHERRFQWKSRERRPSARLIGRRVMRPATQVDHALVASRAPRGPAARARRAPPCGTASTRPAVQITLTRPVSSSRLRNTMPFAVAGCWRCVTTPATSTTVRSGSSRSSAAVTTPWRVSSSRTNSVGCRPADSPIAQRSARGLLDLGHPRQRRRLGAGDDAGQRLDDRAVALHVGPASRSAPAAHSAARRDWPKHARTRPRSRAPRPRRPARRCAGRSLRGRRTARSARSSSMRSSSASCKPAHVPQPEPHRVDRRLGVRTRHAAGRSGSTSRGARLERASRRDALSIGPEHLARRDGARRARSCAASRSPSAARSAARHANSAG